MELSTISSVLDRPVVVVSRFGQFDERDRGLLGGVSLYAVLIWPLIWGITEQTTYNGYLLPRFQVLSGSTAFAVAAVAFSWSFQHVVMPLTFDPEFMIYRLLSPMPFAVFITLLYLRIRRILPLAAAHWLMDGASAFAGTLWPVLQ